MLSQLVRCDRNWIPYRASDTYLWMCTVPVAVLEVISVSVMMSVSNTHLWSVHCEVQYQQTRPHPWWPRMVLCCRNREGGHSRSSRWLASEEIIDVGVQMSGWKCEYHSFMQMSELLMVTGILFHFWNLFNISFSSIYSHTVNEYLVLTLWRLWPKSPKMDVFND